VARQPVRERGHQRRRVDACDRGLTRAVDVGQQELVRAGQRGRELVQEIARARVAVGLERDDQPAAVEARGGDRGRQLGRMVAVVVDDQHLGHLAADREAPVDALEAGQRLAGGGERHAQEVGHAERGQRVARVVNARHANAHLAVRLAADADAEARAARPGVDYLAAPVARHQAVGGVAFGDERRQARRRGVIGADHDQSIKRHLLGKV
jgi:hypothetical protein